MLAFEAGRKHRIRVNAISAGIVATLYYFTSLSLRFAFVTSHFMIWFSGPLRSRAAKAIGFIDTMIEYSLANAPLQKELSAGDFQESHYIFIFLLCLKVCSFFITMTKLDKLTKQMRWGTLLPS